MSLTLEGTLSDVGLCDLLHLVAREKRTGTLCVTLDGAGWQFALHHGAIHGVRCDDGRDEPEIEATILSLVRHRRGTFRLDPPGADDPDGEGEVPVAGVQAEVLAAAGEAELAKLRERIEALGGERALLDRDRFPTPELLESLDADQREVFSYVNGERLLDDVMVRSGFDPLIVLDAIDVLVEASLVKVEAPPPLPVEEPAASDASPLEPPVETEPAPGSPTAPEVSPTAPEVSPTAPEVPPAAARASEDAEPDGALASDADDDLDAALEEPGTPSWASEPTALAPEPASVARSQPRGPSALGRALGAWRDYVATVLPIVLLFVWLGVSGAGQASAPRDPFAIRHDPLAAARAAHEVERLRAALEAHRFAEGTWPERLQTLVQRGYVPMAALTDSRGRPYYYAKRDDGFVLLAPER
jgi:hypothetical protein